MRFFASTDLTPAYPGTAQLGLGIGDVETFTAYVLSLGNALGVPPWVLLIPSFNAVLPPARRDLHYWCSGELNGAPPAVLHVPSRIAHLTGEADAQHPSFHSLVEFFNLVDRGCLSQTPTGRWMRWCSS